ncbi:hypothetical protein [Mucilaginibacter antarcticus]
MKRLLIILITFFSSQLFAQQGVKPALNLKWEIIENNYQNKQQSLAALTINTGPQFTLPAKGWKLYFNF